MTSRSKLTIADLRAGRGVVQRPNIFVTTTEEAVAADAAEIDMITVPGGLMHAGFRAAAPTAFITSGIGYTSLVSADEHVRAAFDLMNVGADAIYCVAGILTLARMAEEGVPVISHVGLIPSKASWTGGFRAVGKTAASALDIWRHVQQLQDAGVFGAEIEVVPPEVAAEISRRTSLFMISMGAGNSCDAQYLFSEDILGSNTGHYPRHSKRYRDFASEYARLQVERTAAYREYAEDVTSGRFPAAEHLVPIDPVELQGFLDHLDPFTTQSE
jgi:3-methyl-2-oxobutanoate hydroxymethyltransferase